MKGLTFKNPVGPQISGMSFTDDKSKPAGQRVVEVLIGAAKFSNLTGLNDSVCLYSIRKCLVLERRNTRVATE